jgi:uncharacterized phiE125 gp8 family phage protein
MSLKLITAPAAVISLEDAKKHLRVDHDEDDDLIEAFVAAATEFVDGPKGFLGRALNQQTWDLYLDEFPCRRGSAFYRRGGSWQFDPIEVPLPPLISVDGVFYIDASAVEQEVNASAYRVDPNSEPGRIVPVSGGAWPTVPCTPGAVRVRFTAGYIDAGNSPPTSNVPKPIRAGILLYLGDLYANRESMLTGPRAAAVTLPWAAEQLLRPHRFTLSMA